MLTTFYPPHNFGGDGIGVQRLSRALARRGHHVTVVHDTDAYNTLHAGPAPKAGAEEDGVRVVRLRSGVGMVSPVLTQQLGRPVVNGGRIRRLLDEGAFDVIMYHNTSLIGGPGLLAYGNALKLYEAHEHWLVCPTHVLWKDNREPCTRRDCFRCTLHHGRPPQAWRYTGFLERQLRHIDAFIAKSEFSRAKHVEFGFPREMRVIPYFLPEEAPRFPGEAAGPVPGSMLDAGASASASGVRGGAGRPVEGDVGARARARASLGEAGRPVEGDAGARAGASLGGAGRPPLDAFSGSGGGVRGSSSVILSEAKDPDAPAANSAEFARRPYFLFVGRLEKIKGLDDVIPAFAQLPDVDLLIAGDGDYAPTLRALAANVPNVRFLGRIAPDALRTLYEDAIALVVPSVCFETFGIILIEAFRQGTPVVARRIGPFPEIVEASGGGVLFERGDELPALLRRLQGDAALRDGLARSAAAAFRTHWAESAVIPQYLELIADVATAKGRGDIAERLLTESVA
jgi:glycosyltransferase involved in cell wall biosynthesis